jgi:uncharacterized RDD family membrane protein YckC
LALIPRLTAPESGIASLPRRVLAGTIDAVPFTAIVLLTRRADVRRRHRWDVFLVALEGIYGMGFTARFGQTPGEMIMGIRVVDADSRERPPWRRVVVRWAAAGFPFRLAMLLPPSRSALRLEELRPEIQRLQHVHQDDRRRRDEEVIALYHRHDVSPLAGILRAVLVEALDGVNLVLGLRDARRRGLADRAANTIVIRLPARGFVNSAVRPCGSPCRGPYHP